MSSSRLYFLIVLYTLSSFCSTKHVKEKEGNIFDDPVIMEIFTLQDNRDTDGLLGFLKSGNPYYRRYATLSLGSVQDLKSVSPLTALLNDRDKRVKASAAYSLGQIGDSRAEVPLIKAFENEWDPKVKKFVLEAIGKSGTEKGMKFLLDLISKDRDISDSVGIAMGLYRFLLRKIFSEESIRASVKLVAKRFPVQTRFYASNFLARLKNRDLTPYSDGIFKALSDEKDIFIRMNHVLALGKISSDKSMAKLMEMVESKEDYRIRINALRALGSFKTSEIKDIVLKEVEDKERNVALTATQILLGRSDIVTSGVAFNMAKRSSDVRIRSLLLSAALKFAEDKSHISDSIVEYYRNSDNPVEKGLLLRSLSYFSGNLKFIEHEIFANRGRFVSTKGMNSVADMVRRLIKDKRLKGNKLFDINGFSKLLMRGVNSGDSALAGLSASLLREPELEMKKRIRDISFIKKALNQCLLPGDIEKYMELKKTINYFEGRNEKIEVGRLKTMPIDWQIVKTISSDAKVLIRTDRGDILIGLLVNLSPGSVSNFVKLIKENFYRKSIFHRVVPNFVVQGGCPRGDGWGSPGYSIRSEFFPAYYGEGTLGMASAGKDTEGSQWFITHSPTPHLDGRYTVFGRVKKGMDVVHRIRLGDRIRGFKLFR